MKNDKSFTSTYFLYRKNKQEERIIYIDLVLLRISHFTKVTFLVY